MGSRTPVSYTHLDVYKRQHLSWYTMKGEGKRDYPASILHQSAWYPEYHYLEDYFSRIHAALHGAKMCIRDRSTAASIAISIT